MTKISGLIPLVATFFIPWIPMMFIGHAHANETKILAQNGASDDGLLAHPSILIRSKKITQSKGTGEQVRMLIAKNLMERGFVNIVDRQDVPNNVSPLPGLSSPGADIIVEFEVLFNNSRSADNKTVCRLSIQAIESDTNRKLASMESIGKSYSRSVPGEENRALVDVVHKAMPKFIKQLIESLQLDARLGRAYKIIILNPPVKSDMKINGILRRTCKRVRIGIINKTRMSFNVRCSKDPIGLAEILKAEINKKFPKKKFEFVQRTARVIMLKFQ